MLVKGKKKIESVKEAIADLGMNPKNAKSLWIFGLGGSVSLKNNVDGNKTKCLSISLLVGEENKETEK